MPFAPYPSTRLDTKKILVPSLENRGCDSSAIPRVTGLADAGSEALALMIQRSRSVRPGSLLEYTMCWPSGDQSGWVAAVSGSHCANVVDWSGLTVSPTL